MNFQENSQHPLAVWLREMIAKTDDYLKESREELADLRLVITAREKRIVTMVMALNFYVKQLLAVEESMPLYSDKGVSP